MIQSKSIDWAYGTARQFVCQDKLPWTLSASAKSGTVYLSVAPMTSKSSGSSRRAPGDFLLQGGPFDRYGNNAVSNVQWNITVGQDNWSELNPSGDTVYCVERPSSSEYCMTISDPYPVQTGGRTRLIADETVEWATCSGRPSSTTSHLLCHAMLSVVPGPKDSAYEGRYAVINRFARRVVQRINGDYRLVNEDGILVVSDEESSPFTGTPIWSRPLSLFETADKTTFAAWSSASTACTAAMTLALPSMDAADLSLIPPKCWRRARELTQKVADCEAFDVDSIPDHVIEAWQREFNSYVPAIEHKFDALDRSEVAQAIMESINLFDGNTIAYAKDLTSFGDTLKSAVSLIGDYKDPKKWASAWLSGRFGDRLSIKDTGDAIKAVRRDLRNMRQHLLLYRSTITRTDSGSVLGIPYDTKSTLCGTIGLSGGLLGDLENALAAPYRWDFGLTLGNTWDLIPFSFVVDWIVDIGAILNQIDLMQETRLIDIKTQYASTKYVTCMSLTALTGGEYTGTIERVSYQRSHQKVDTWLRLKAFDGYFLTSARPVNFVDSVGLLVQSLN